MKKYISAILAASMVISMTACGENNADLQRTGEYITESITENFTETEITENQTDSTGEVETGKNEKVLIAYFSYGENAALPDGVDASTSASINIRNGKTTGNTGVIADMIAEKTGGELSSILTEKKYPADYNEVVEQGKAENQADIRPELISKIENLDEYDTIFVGFPNWWYDMPMVMYSFFDEYDFSGKTIIPFCTSGGSGFSNSISTIKSLEPNADVVEDGLSISGSRVDDAQSDVTSWLSELGY